MDTKKKLLKGIGYPMAACATFALVSAPVFAEENDSAITEDTSVPVEEGSLPSQETISTEPTTEESDQEQLQEEVDQINEAIDQREQVQKELDAESTEDTSFNETLTQPNEVKKAPQQLKANEVEKTTINFAGWDFAWFTYHHVSYHDYHYREFKDVDIDTAILSFEEDGLFNKLAYTFSSGQVMVGKEVINPNDDSYWTLIGYVPVMDFEYGRPKVYGYYNSGHQEENELYKKYYEFASQEDAISFVQDHGGVLYGEHPTEDLLKENGYIIGVWYKKAFEVPKNKDTEFRDIQPVPPVDYQPTTEGLIKDVEVIREGTHSKVIYTVTIPKDIDDKELNINVLDFGEVIVPGNQPGDTIEYEIHVIDLSGQYKYKAKSGAEGTIAYDGETVIGKGFEGYDIFKTQGNNSYSTYSRRGINRPLEYLLKDEYPGYGIDDLEYLIKRYHLTWTDLIGDALITHGYGSEFAQQENPDYEAVINKYLHKYYIDWFSINDPDGKTYTSFDELSREQIGILYKSVNSIQETETNGQVASGLYWGFYEHLFPISGDGSDYRGSYSWMKKPTGFGPQDGNTFDEVTSSQWNSSKTVLENATKYVIHYYQYIDGEYNGNNMQDTKFFIGVQFKLEKDEPDTPEPPKPTPPEPEKPTPPEPEKPTQEQPKIEVATGVFVDAQIWMSLMGASAATLAGAKLHRRNKKRK